MQNTKTSSFYNSIKNLKGFNTIQMLVVITITAILSGFAAPAYAKMLVEQYKSAALYAFHHSVILAKTEAIKSLKTIVLCPSVDGVQCNINSIDYSSGWIVFINENKGYPVVRDDGEDLLDSVRLKNSDFELISNRKLFTFRPISRRSTNGTLMFCPLHQIIKDDEYQAVILSYTGRPRIELQPSPKHLDICD